MLEQRLRERLARKVDPDVAALPYATCPSCDLDARLAEHAVVVELGLASRWSPTESLQSAEA